VFKIFLTLVTVCTAGAFATGGKAGLRSPEQTPAHALAYPGPCPVGSWRLSNLVHRAGGPAGVYFTGGGSMTATFTKGGNWTFSDDGSKTLKAHLQTGGVSIVGTAKIVGKVWGVDRGSGSAYVFGVRGSRGTVEIASQAGSKTQRVSSVTTALVPTGQATVGCSGSKLTITSTAFTMTWAYRGGKPRPPANPPPPPASGTLVISSSGTNACKGRAVRVTGGADRVVLTGSCRTVTVASTASNVDVAKTGTLVVSGSGNNVKVGQVTEIRATGTGNNVIWSGPEPTISDTGTGNVIRQS
jgi:hypothetical protein